ncbi:MAG: helix-turn-helix transcriptional regulator [Gammaproteobacteria bacterium]|nr:helix-turn-helix transcriptional regulator [Gammaproteobacteria bacterium]
MTQMILSKNTAIRRVQSGLQLIPAETQDPFLLNIQQLLELPLSTYFLDREGLTQTINEEGLMTCGFDSEKQAMGKSIMAVSKRESAQQLISNCHEVIQYQSVKFFDEMNLRKDGIHQQYLSIKFPCYDQTMQVLGVFGISIVLGKHSLAESMALVQRMGLLSSPPESTVSFSIVLTPREQACLHWLTKGFTAKMIAKELDISHRTVEEYIANIKSKFGAHTKSQLIEMLRTK